LTEPKENDWAVKKDGGEFDQFTGATITPRAVVRSVRLALTFFQKHGKDIVERSNETKQEVTAHGE
jgi:electron transport complex protein RnfG